MPIENRSETLKMRFGNRRLETDMQTDGHVPGAPPKYAVVIQWSDEDQLYIASLPEWGPYAHAHGSRYEEAAKNAREVLELLLEDEYGKPVNAPSPHLFRHPGAGLVDLPDDSVGDHNDAFVKEFSQVQKIA